MENNERKAVEEDVKRYSMLQSLENSEAGQMVILSLKKDVMGAIEKIKSSYKTASESELRTWCAVLDSRMTLLQAFQNAPKNKDGAVKILEELMKATQVEE